MKKSLLLLTLCLFMLLGLSTANASSDIKVVFNGTVLELEYAPFMEEGSTLVQMRDFFEAQGAGVYWEAETKTAVGIRGNVRFRIPTTSPEAAAPETGRDSDAGEVLTIHTMVKVVDGRIYIPLRAVSEALGDKVVWDSAARTVYITSSERSELSFGYTFEECDHGWTGDFTDLPADYEEDMYDLKFAHAARPAEVGEGKALMLRGINRSDDLFMYAKKGLTAEDGIKPDTTYMVRMEVEFATNAPAGAVGVGGPPGEAVWVKVGASSKEPVPVIEYDMGMLYYLLNVDKGRQNEDGENAVRVGDVAKEHCGEFDIYELKTLDNKDNPLKVTSDGEGNLWIFVGTDSGFEGKTVLYYTSIKVNLVPVCR